MLRTLSLLALLCAAPLFAQDTPTETEPGLKVGDDVADFAPRNWINQPAWESFAELKGDVILLKAWGIN